MLIKGNKNVGMKYLNNITKPLVLFDGLKISNINITWFRIYYQYNVNTRDNQ